jgi:hypothetical protein
LPVIPALVKRCLASLTNCLATPDRLSRRLDKMVGETRQAAILRPEDSTTYAHRRPANMQVSTALKP